MSDYMFMLDSHLNGEQSKALAEVRDAAEQANLNLFITGGAMRDMMGGFPIRDLDFTVEGGSIKFAKTVAHKAKADVLAVDDLRKSVELVFPGHVSASISMARLEKYPKPGAKPGPLKITHAPTPKAKAVTPAREPTRPTPKAVPKRR